MEDFGDILFFLVAILFAIVGAISKKKKGVPVLFPETSDEDDEVLEMPEKKVVVRESAPDIIVEQDFSWDDFNYEDDVERNPEKFFESDSPEITSPEPMAARFAREGISSMPGNIASEVITDQDDEITIEKLVDLVEEDSKAAIIAADFNLAEAIIYSEIINRKDFT